MMDVMEYVWLEFEVTVSTAEYTYQGVEGMAKMKFKFPRVSLETLDTGNLLTTLLPSALQELQANLDEKETDD